MTIHNLYIFDRHCHCISFTSWTRPVGASKQDVQDTATQQQNMQATGATGMSLEEEAKLVYGVVFSLRNLVSKLSAKPGSDGFISYRTSTYKLHYFETPTGLKFVLNTDPHMESMREALRTIYGQIYVEYVVKNPLMQQLTQSGVHPVQNDLFRGNLQRFVRSLPGFE